MKRAIQRLIQDPLALKILDGEIHPGDEVTVDADPKRRRDAVRTRAGAKVGSRMKIAAGHRNMKTLKTTFLLTALTLLLLALGQAFGGSAA